MNTCKKIGSGKHVSFARTILCLMLAVVMAVPMASPTDVYAAGSSGSTSGSVKSYTTATTQNISGITVVFNSAMISNERLPSAPAYLKAKGKAKKVALSWTAADTGVDGYIIVRRDFNADIWRQIATVGPKATSYTDKTAKTKNKYYRYSVLGYKMVSGGTMVSTAAGWAGAVTTKSKKKNVNSLTVSNPANVTIVAKGSCAQTYLKFPSKAYSKYIRWSSNNEKVATINSSGLITGVNTGTATISVRSHTGYILKFKVKVIKPGTAQAMIDTFNAWNGYSRLNGKHKGIIDIYNSLTPWPGGYKMKYSDAWCDATVTAAAIKSGNVDKVGRECSVPRHIKIFKSLGIWEEDGTIVPKPGDLIVYSWNKAKQPNNASASHIGLVVKVEGKQITCIEGNRGVGVVSTRTIPVGWGYIRGYGRPNYAK